MIESEIPKAMDAPDDAALRDALAQDDLVLGRMGPILGHLLANQGQSLFSDEIIARIRGMGSHMARQMLLTQAAAIQGGDQLEFADKHCENLAGRLMECGPLMAHCHALALEWQLAMRLDASHAADPVLPPLLQALVGSDDEAAAQSAMAALTAQARFIEQQRRMELPLAELPGDLFHQALLIWLNYAGENVGEKAAEAEATLRNSFDESAGRRGLLARLVTDMGNGAIAALSISHAGAAIFLTTLALASNQDRDIAAISTNERQIARLALAMRASGMSLKDVEEQFLTIHPELALPEGFSDLGVDQAVALLANSGRVGGS